MHLCGDERVVPCHAHSLVLGSHRIIVLSHHMVALELLSKKPMNIVRTSIQTDCYQIGIFEPVNADFGGRAPLFIF